MRERIVEELSNFKLTEPQILPIRIKYKMKIHTYYIINIFKASTNKIINWAESTFINEDINTGKIYEFKTKDYRDFLKKFRVKSTRLIKRNLVIEQNINLDLFRVGTPLKSPFYIASEDFIQFANENKFTGLTFKSLRLNFD